MRIVVAPDKFRGSLTAADVCRIVSRACIAADPNMDVVSVPVSDGGEGTLDVAIAAGYERVPIEVTGPLGEDVRATYARRGPDAIVELAATCGLALVPPGERDAMKA